MRLPLLSIALCGLLPLLPQSPDPSAPRDAGAKAPRKERRFEFTYRAEVKDLPAGSKRADLWIPVPTSDAFQTIEGLTVECPVPHEFTIEKEYGNRLLHARAEPAAAFAVTMRFGATRTEQQAAKAPGRDKMRPRLLAPDLLVPLDGKAKEISSSIAAGAEEPRKKARILYDHVLSKMTYDKSGKGWGRGDFNYACEVGKGNCTDFHAMFIGLARASAIPALFEIGFSIPPDKTEGPIAGYHCWAEFESSAEGWVPTDISEASKDPAMREYYFGRLTPDRVVFSRGRDLTLEPKQAGGPVNFLVYPYLEVDGKAHDGVARTFSFRDR
ncbi:MAG: transglutaminase-like domain-containing protein [Planctomycetes bacterium]|nr:transglutaminase-like domain-containing protein [Planctomycetota bacterium]